MRHSLILPISSWRYLTFSFPLFVLFSANRYPDFRSVADPHSRTHLQIAFTEQSFQTFSGNSATTVQYPEPSSRNVLIRALSSYERKLTKVNCNYDLKYWKKISQCCIASKHKNINVIMTSQQKLYSSLSYFNNKINLCSVVKFVLEGCISVNLTYVK